MVRAVLGGSREEGEQSRQESAREAVRETVRWYIDRTTGVQTLAQMRGLVDIVRDFGFVPEGEILDEHGYKALYNQELLSMVRGRVDLLERGCLDVSDFAVKNAPAFLRALAERGVTLWLASGTDQGDVEAEAAALGYADLFQGRIHGAVGDLGKEPKRIVLNTILSRIGASAAASVAASYGPDGPGRQPGVVTFGDGPVEFMETVKRGGTAVGVASDEIRRWGWNMRKRQRLIEAGAAILVPDFSEMRRLIALLEAP
jgi:phosphoglycolate phosphatase-like HAD superfamily hydrolase